MAPRKKKQESAQESAQAPVQAQHALSGVPAFLRASFSTAVTVGLVVVLCALLAERSQEAGSFAAVAKERVLAMLGAQTNLSNQEANTGLQTPSGWYVQQEGVFFGTTRVLETDAASFEAHACGYATDASIVFSNGKAASHLSSKDFSVISCEPRIAKNSEFVFLDEAIIREADPLSFSLLGDGVHGYAKDEDTVFYFDMSSVPRLKVVEAADPHTFKANFTDKQYAVDEEQVYFKGTMLEGIESATFSYLGNGYTRSGETVFFQNKVIEGVDETTFRIADGGWFDAEDEAQWYLKGEPTRPSSEEEEEEASEDEEVEVEE